MPYFKLPKPKKHKEEMEAVPSGPDNYERQITLPVNDAILDETEMDQEVVVTIIGKVSAMRSSRSEHYNEKNITVTATSVEVYPNDGDEDDAMPKGYERG